MVDRGRLQRAKKKPPGSRRPARSAGAEARSRITNGRELLPGVDGRSLWVRRFRDLINLHTSDLGGADNASEGEKALVRRAACLIVELEQMEVGFAREGRSTPIELDNYQRATNTLRRCLESLGLQRRPKNLTPSLAEYLHNRTIDLEPIDGEIEGAAE